MTVSSVLIRNVCNAEMSTSRLVTHAKEAEDLAQTVLAQTRVFMTVLSCQTVPLGIVFLVLTKNVFSVRFIISIPAIAAAVWDDQVLTVLVPRLATLTDLSCLTH